MYSCGKHRIKKNVPSGGYIIGVPKDIFAPSVETGERIPKPKDNGHIIKYYSDSWDAFSMFIQYFSTKAFN